MFKTLTMRNTLILLITILFTYNINAQEQGITDTTKVTPKINWLTLDQALELNKSNPKKIFIDVYTTWCGWCKVMDKETFTHPQIVEFINEKFHPVKFNAEQKESVTYNNKVYSYITRKDTATGKTSKYHEMAVYLLNGKLSYPSFAFLDEKSKLLFSVAGYMKPKQLEPVITYVGDNGYLEPHWELYLKGFQSKIKE